MKALGRKRVNLFLPKFQVSFQLSLTHTLRDLGMADAFNAQKADFTGMTGGRDLFISAAIHKAFVEVTEEGTEAAAATGITMATRSGVPTQPEEPVLFRADHPFVYLIRHNASRTILFIGRLAEPAKP